ncbi:HCO3 transporter family-domain-containing protein [Pelagophyceae sp. CCMP2097]|nr:HCO3 transporter family-domain-containing protein [Pelagophyceae sp. CCMP2097]
MKILCLLLLRDGSPYAPRRRAAARAPKLRVSDLQGGPWRTPVADRAKAAPAATASPPPPSVPPVVSSPQVFVANDGSLLQLFDNGVVLPLGWTGSSVRRRTGARFAPASASIFGSTAWPVGESSANPKVIGVFDRKSWMLGIVEDFKRRRTCYASDWLDGLRSPGKTVGAVVFLYMAVLAPAIAFGGVMETMTAGAMGPRDVLVSCGLSGMAYAALAGQPMTFLAPTGLTLSFIGALSAWTRRAGVPFVAMYAWCGLWTSGLLILLATFNASGLIRYCTRFTEDIFNALLGLNFIVEGLTPLLRLLRPALAAAARGTSSAADALVAINVALATSTSCRAFAGATRTRYFTARARTLVADFGPACVIIFMSAIMRSPAARRLGDLQRLNLQPGGARGIFRIVDLSALPVKYRLLAALPALFLATLFFLDQNITVRTVNSPANKLTKGAAYHLDLLALGLITGCTSLLGLPWMCSATVQSLNHLRALSTYDDAADDAPPAGGAGPTIANAAANAKAAAAKAASARNAPLTGPPSSIAPPAALMSMYDIIAATKAPANGTPANGAADGSSSASSSAGSAAAAADGAPAPAAANAAFDESPAASPPPAGGGATAVANLARGAASPASYAAPPASTGVQVQSVVETRLTGFLVHALVLASLYAAPVISEVPLAVVWGVFLFLGRKVLLGNQFIERTKALVVDKSRLDPSQTVERSILELGRMPVLKFTVIQAACLSTLWMLKLNRATAMIFPSVIGVLLILRAAVLPKVFAARELLTLDTELDI